MQKIILLAMDFFDYFHKQKIINFLKKKNKSFDVFIDIGAHKGETIELFTKTYDKPLSFDIYKYDLTKSEEKKMMFPRQQLSEQHCWKCWWNGK